MRKIAILMGLLILIGLSCNAMAAAPNSGDGMPDGSGMDNPIHNGDPNPVIDFKGPAPNSGDGIPDGSGF
ncbi:hypothetical protein [Methanosarcina sp. MTP4]|uniref:hypothetical protein n=1 Tax=Methanosarcina sp. MTP4 TaxID=1434100 RepID=UPI0012E04873|nr:hypothetical protein [Methanosarcina sp. MTP4]